MQTFTLTQADVNFNQLMRELLAASPALVTQEGEFTVARYTIIDHATTIDLVVPDDCAAAVQTAIAAHNPTAPDAIAQQQTTDGVSMSDLAAQYQAGLTTLDNISDRMTTVEGSTIGNVAAASTAIKAIASDVKLLVIIQRRLLKALRVMARRHDGL